jgi:nucleoside-triphosphatase THEP1/energy-coupling factor transporter transmembrane protein EcfT
MSRRIAALALVLAAVAALSDDLKVVAAAAAAAVLSAIVLDPPVVRSALRFAAVLTIALTAAVAGAAVALVEGPARGLGTASGVVGRVLILWIAAGVLGRRVDADRLVDGARRLGLERLGLVLGLALNALPRLVEAASEVWMVHRLRSPNRWAALRHSPRLAEVLLANAARIGDDAAAAAALRGHSGLAQPRRPALEAPAPVVVVTGAPGSGKTAAVEAAVGVMRSRGSAVVGIVQPAVFSHGRKVGFMVRDLATGTEAALAEQVERGRGEHGTPFRFAREGLDVARRALGRVGPGSVLVVDEVGPIELRGDGHMPALRRALAAPGLAAVVLVVRRQLVPSLLAALVTTDVTIVDVEEDPGTAVERMMAALT